jgi:hypothetical protein
MVEVQHWYQMWSHLKDGHGASLVYGFHAYPTRSTEEGWCSSGCWVT